VSRPIAHLLTWTCYGTWLHGDARGSVDASRRLTGKLRLEPDERLRGRREAALTAPPVLLGSRERSVVERAIQTECRFRVWALLAVNARSNHVHCVISAPDEPSRALRLLKSAATRELRRGGLFVGRPVWTRKGSTRPIWSDEQARQAVRYVRDGQDDPSRFGNSNAHHA
jgi:REP element-mobilizing transposase RayT